MTETRPGQGCVKVREEVAPSQVGLDVTLVTVATTLVMKSDTPLICASH